MAHHVIHCQHCRTEVPEEAAHCPNCGQPMPRHLIPPGTVVGDDYEIVRLLGYGGMGEVYLARHHLTGQQVAIKVLALHLAEEVDLRIRFLDEARILARLDHPNIVMLHNFKQEGARMLLVMQYVDGIGLDHLLARDGPMHPERAALLFAPLCDALHHAHENDIVHRDIKPSNILVDKSGKGRLTDFGIGKLTRGGANLTRTGTRVGTSWFMSPEQGMNRPADARSDIYCLGVTLYNALSGRLPFYGESEYEVIKGHVELPPPPIYRSDHPFARAMEEIVMRALEKNPDDRFQQGVEMRDALLDALAAYGEETEVRGAGGTGVFAIHKVSGAPASAAGAARQARQARAKSRGRAPAPGSPAAAPPHNVHNLPTSVDPVYSVVTGEIRTVTPPLGAPARSARVSQDGQPESPTASNGLPNPAPPPAPHRTPPMPSRVGEAMPAPPPPVAVSQPNTQEALEGGAAPAAAAPPRVASPPTPAPTPPRDRRTPPRAPFTPTGHPALGEVESASAQPPAAPSAAALDPTVASPAPETGPAAEAEMAPSSASSPRVPLPPAAAAPASPVPDLRTAPLGGEVSTEASDLGLAASFGEGDTGAGGAPEATRSPDPRGAPGPTSETAAPTGPLRDGAPSESAPPAVGQAGAVHPADSGGLQPAARRRTSPFGEPAIPERPGAQPEGPRKTASFPRPRRGESDE